MSVLVHRTMSLDGFIAGPNHEMDWMFGYERPAWAEEVMRETGAIVAGRGAYGVNERAGSGPTSRPYGGAWSGPVFMVTHQRFDDLPDWITPVSGDIRDIIGTAKAAAGGRTVEVFGGKTAAQCFAAGLVTDVVVYVLPLIMGEGIAFSPGSGHVELELVDSSMTGGVAALRYRVIM